jgi:hypothetical protein
MEEVEEVMEEVVEIVVEIDMYSNVCYWRPFIKLTVIHDLKLTVIH